MAWLAGVAGLFAAIGLMQALAGLLALRRFRAAPPPRAGGLPPVSILKPLHGDEPLLEAALASVCAQDYPGFQIVFGLHRADDPALAVVRRLQARFPAVDIAVVVDPRRHGANGKVSNLINMLPAARHALLVISDADVHAAPDYLRHVVAALQQPGVGLVTTLYSGLAAAPGIVARLGAAAITQVFLPGALLARGMGRQDCLGATMALHRDVLARIGGFQALADELADDNVLGQLVRAQGFAVRLAASIPATSVTETDLQSLIRHELRWSRTIRALAPLGFALSALQYPLAWAALAFVISGGASLALAGFTAAWAIRAGIAMGADAALPPRPRATAAPLLLLPLRDLLSMAILCASYMSDEVEWRGQRLAASPARFSHTAKPRGLNAEDPVPPASIV